MAGRRRKRITLESVTSSKSVYRKLNPYRSALVSCDLNDCRPYLTRHLPNSYRRRVQALAEHFGVSQEEMVNCTLGYGLSALEQIKRGETELTVTATATVDTLEGEPSNGH